MNRVLVCNNENLIKNHKVDDNNFIHSDLLTAKQAAMYLNVTGGALRNMCYRGKITYYRIGNGKTIRFKKMDLEKLLVRVRT